MCELARYIFIESEDVHNWRGTFPQKAKMCIIGEAHPHNILALKMCLTNYAHTRFLWRCALLFMHILPSYEDVPIQLCIPSLLKKMCLTNYAHPCFLERCASQIMHILADVPLQLCASSPHQLCSSSPFMKMCLANYAHPHFLWKCASPIMHILAS